MTHSIFLASLISGIMIFLSIIWSIFLPGKRIWPPPRRRSWQFWFTWILYPINIVGAISLGWLDWNSGGLTHWIRYPSGVILIIGGLAFANWGIQTLGWHRSSGLKGSFVHTGPYQFSRNPQYVGDSLAMLGYAIFTNSSMVLAVHMIVILAMLLTPFAEETWLEERFGDDYRRYKTQTPRYFLPHSR